MNMFDTSEDLLDEVLDQILEDERLAVVASMRAKIEL